MEVTATAKGEIAQTGTYLMKNNALNKLHHKYGEDNL